MFVMLVYCCLFDGFVGFGCLWLVVVVFRLRFGFVFILGV